MQLTGKSTYNKKQKKSYVKQKLQFNCHSTVVYLKKNIVDILMWQY